MEEFIQYLKTFNLKALFYEKTENTITQFFRYIFVGGVAFLADWGVLWVCSQKIHYLLSAAIAFVIGLIVNYIISTKFVFSEKKKNKIVEFLIYAMIGVIGLLLTELLMYLLTDIAGVYFMISKIITAAIVLLWNFAARKMVLYKGEKR